MNNNINNSGENELDIANSTQTGEINTISKFVKNLLTLKNPDSMIKDAQ